MHVEADSRHPSRDRLTTTRRLRIVVPRVAAPDAPAARRDCVASRCQKIIQPAPFFPDVVVTNVRNPRPGVCPDPEELAAFVDGRLPEGARADMERHLAECAGCRELFAEVVRLTEAQPDPDA